MEGIRQYILSVACVGVLCTLVQLLITGSGTVQSVVKLVTGVVLSVSVISPLLQLDDLQFDRIFESISDESQWAVSEGERAAERELSGSIKEQTESYICSKADEWGMNVRVEVTVSGETPPVPEAVTIEGTVSPYGKRQLSRCIANDLGIAEEDQEWIS